MLYRQERVGIDGTAFTMCKLRHAARRWTRSRRT
ncbi:hypothetical protein QJS66_07700 [Kocuria rhizophila]|nr:hypothetical protein QJS66_07700 [Kocuria rhizophila]